MKALVACGGKGTRMGKITTNKCLLPVGGQPIVEHSVNSLKKSGIKDISVITGFKKEDVELVLGDKVTYFHHENYETMGLIASILLAKDKLYNEDFVLVMGDLFYDERMAVAALKATEDVVITYERKDEYVPEDSKAIIENDQIKFMGKDILPDETSGEFGHMAKFSVDGSKKFFDEIELFIERGDVFAYLMDVFNEMISRGQTLTALDITGLPRVEIDFMEDLKTAETLILPQIKKCV